MNKKCWDCNGKDANKLPCLDCEVKDKDNCKCKTNSFTDEDCYGKSSTEDEELRQIVHLWKGYTWLKSRTLGSEQKEMIGKVMKSYKESEK